LILATSMSIKKITLFILLSAIVAGFSGGTIASAQSLTIEELQSMIAQLQAQIAQLQQQLQAIESTASSTVWCYSFENSFRLGDTGDDVKALQTALENEGLFSVDKTGYFGPLTFEAVVKFQEKYQKEILTPFGLTQGTGYVGRTTKAQLNTLYACKEEVIAPGETPVAVPEETVDEPPAGPTLIPPEAIVEPSEEVVIEVDLTPSLSLIAPKGGEKWDIGKDYEILWDSQNIAEVNIDLYRGSEFDQTIISSVDGASGVYLWTIPKGMKQAFNYILRIYEKGNVDLFDESSSFFNIVIDSVAPVRSDAGPSGALSSDTLETLISLETDERATCRYTTRSTVDYYSMIDTFDTTDATSHATLVTGLRSGNAYTYYVKCLDVAGNRNFLNFRIEFTVAF